MRTIKIITAALVVASLAAVPFAAQAGKCKQTPVYGAQPGSTVLAPLTEEETATLQWVREEEKLARDVYTAFAAQYPGAKIFVNIAASEQKHFDAMGRMIALFGVDDPALDAPGFFANPELQALYDRLLAQGQESFIEALKVGVDIEEMDITDLAVAMDETTRTPLDQSYGHLLRGSENHLAAFTKQLAKLGVVLD